jgi:hypothetical protein
MPLRLAAAVQCFLRYVGEEMPGVFTEGLLKSGLRLLKLAYEVNYLTSFLFYGLRGAFAGRKTSLVASFGARATGWCDPSHRGAAKARRTPTGL